MEPYNTPTLDELEVFFKDFKEKTHNGVPGVVCVRAKKPGPVLGITACTHGNEPSGLAVLKYLLDNNIEEMLVSGSLYLVVNNLDATERYFSSLKNKDGASARARFVDVNMNRLPKNLPEIENDTRKEIARAQSLLPIWQEFTVGFDIHSTLQDSAPMIIAMKDVFQKELVKGFPIEIVLSAIDTVQIGSPASGFYGQPNTNIPIFEIEAGGHEKPESLQQARICAIALLKNLNMIEGETVPQVKEYKEYVIYDSVVFPDESYTLTKVFENFEHVKKGEVFATGNGADITAGEECHTVFCKTKLRPDSIAEEVMFLSKPVRNLEV